MTTTPAQESTTVSPGDGRSIDDLLRDVSASRLMTFHGCRLRFYFRYVAGIRKPKSPALHVGTSVHGVLKTWNKARWRGESLTLKELHDAYSHMWEEAQQEASVEWGEAEDEERRTGWRLLETYFRESPIPGDERPEAVEVSVESDLTTHGLPRLIGIIDLVRPGGRIVDFKTSGKTPDSQQVSHQLEIQTTAYAILYRESTGRTESGIELHHLVKTKSPKLVVNVLPPASENQQSRLFRVMESYVSGVERQDWVPSPGLQCQGCEFFAQCRLYC